MNLPNYFLADLPSEAVVTPTLVTEACQTLKRNREQHLAHYSTRRLLDVFHELGRSWLDPEYRFRKLALHIAPQTNGFSETTLSSGLDAFFEQITGPNFEELIAQDLGDPQRLDELIVSDGRGKRARLAMARGPELMGHIAAGNLPVAIMLQMLLGLLVRSAQFVKCATGAGAALLPRLFAHSIYELEPKLGACLELAQWAGGNSALETALFGETDFVTATGDDETLSAVRSRLPANVRFLGYGHRVSFGFIAREALSGYDLTRLIENAAADVAAWNQLGCLSPHLFYVEHGGRIAAEQFAEMLASEMARREAIDPRGSVSAQESAAIAIRRSFYELRSAHLLETRQWSSPNSTAWTVVYEGDSQFQISCLNRFIYVKNALSLNDALQAADRIRSHVSTVSLAASEPRAHELALELARWGVPRICPVGQMQHPPLTWRHDGRPALGDLITWTDWEH